MAEPLIVVSKFRVKEGKLEDLAKYYTKVLEIVTANEPQLIAFPWISQRGRGRR